MAAPPVLIAPYREGDLDSANVPPFPIDTARAMRGEANVPEE